MPGNQFQFRTVDEDFPFGSFESQNIGDEGKGYGIEVGLKLDKALGGADPEGDFGTVVRVCGQGKESIFFLFFKEFDNDSSGGIVEVRVGSFPEPPTGGSAQMLHILEVSGIEEIFSTNKNGASILPLVSG